ncbi:Shedu anti-phage system protein SduA domain-containing protein [Desulfonema magnum]|uniref:DUF4263 n=1 Tax=Desulfonema magnum TaxID=45655 RepID=A0A975BWL4_9BACT|nr:Shedu anti-phage system protein SduA domain-containing protein [Desulfonema magnum]QTA93079.1 DUF4263 [Desulfonema magnum]
MKDFQAFEFDPVLCGQELDKFRNLLDTKAELSEQGELLPLFRESENFTALIGNLHPGITKVDKIAQEYDLFGDFVCDFAVGDSNRNAYCFIELENAKRNSIFKKGTRATSEWGYRFEHGFSQVIDWFYKLDDEEKSYAFEDRFGARSIDSMSMLIIGRSEFLASSEQRRLRWRERHVIVHSQQVRCLTYDELFQEFQFMLSIYPIALNAEAETGESQSETNKETS